MKIRTKSALRKAELSLAALRKVKTVLSGSDQLTARAAEIQNEIDTREKADQTRAADARLSAAWDSFLYD